MDKAELRKHLLEKRNSLSRDEVLSASESIIKEIDALIKQNKSIVLLGFMPLGNEIDMKRYFPDIIRMSLILILYWDYQEYAVRK